MQFTLALTKTAELELFRQMIQLVKAWGEGTKYQLSCSCRTVLTCNTISILQKFMALGKSCT